jgi:hypothetical protein
VVGLSVVRDDVLEFLEALEMRGDGMRYYVSCFVLGDLVEGVLELDFEFMFIKIVDGRFPRKSGVELALGEAGRLG